MLLLLSFFYFNLTHYHKSLRSTDQISFCMPLLKKYKYISVISVLFERFSGPFRMCYDQCKALSVCRKMSFFYVGMQSKLPTFNVFFFFFVKSSFSTQHTYLVTVLPWMSEIKGIHFVNFYYRLAKWYQGFTGISSWSIQWL